MLDALREAVLLFDGLVPDQGCLLHHNDRAIHPLVKSFEIASHVVDLGQFQSEWILLLILKILRLTQSLFGTLRLCKGVLPDAMAQRTLVLVSKRLCVREFVHVFCFFQLSVTPLQMGYLLFYF